MIHNRFSVFLFGLSELIKSRSGLRDQFRSTLAGSGKFYTWRTKPERKLMSWPLSCSSIWVCFGVLGLHAEEIWKVVRCLSLHFCAQSWQNHLRGNKARNLNYTWVSPIRFFFKANLLTATQLSRLTFCRPQPHYYLVQVLAAVIPTAAAAAICSVTLLDFARCSPAHTWLRILLLGCRMCHIAAVIRMQSNGAVMSLVQCYVCFKPACLCHH